MQRFKRFLVIYAAFLMLSVTIYSCCSDKFEIISISNIVAVDDTYMEIDTIRNNFAFEVYFEDQVVATLSDSGL